jgi:hypothetical protein
MFDTYSFWDGNENDGWLLVFSNVTLVLVIVYLAFLRDVVTPLLLINTLIASSCYHACRAGFFCEFMYDYHMTWDYLSVYIPIAWMITYLGIHNPQLHIFAFFLSFLVTVPIVLSGVSRELIPLFGIGVPIVISFNHAMLRKHRMFYHLPFAILTFIFAIIAGAFMFLFPHRDYGWAHACWHFFSMLSAFSFAIAITKEAKAEKELKLRVLLSMLLRELERRGERDALISAKALAVELRNKKQ